MTDIWTSERAKAVFGKIGWPKGEHWELRYGDLGVWVLHIQGEWSTTHPILPDLAAALCRDWCESYLRKRYRFSVGGRRDCIIITHEDKNGPMAIIEQPFDEALIAALEWHLAQVTPEAAKGEA